MIRSLKFIALGATALVAFATQLPHPQGTANIYRALRAIGTDNPALNHSSVDNWVGGGLLLALAAVVFGYTFLPSGKTVTAPSPVAKPQVVSGPGLPDLSVRELFLMLVPDLSESPERRPDAEAAGRRLSALLRNGTLIAWGKPDATSRTLRQIAPAYWEQAEWTYWFLPESAHNRELIHATQPDGSAPMRDLHVNAAAARAAIG